MPELKKCPFCGNEVGFAINISGWPYGVYCHRCHMRAEWSNIRDTRNTTAGEIMAQIAEKWNNREIAKNCGECRYRRQDGRCENLHRETEKNWFCAACEK